MRKGFHTLVILFEVENDLWRLLLDFPRMRKTIGYCLEWSVPHSPVGACFLSVVGTTKGLV